MINNNILLIGNIIGAILQPLYTCLFILYTKKINNKRISFIILTIIDYMIIQNVLTFTTGISADLIFAIVFYINLKIIYKSKARITDLVTYILSDILLGIISILTCLIFGMNIVSLILVTILPILIVLLARNKLNIIDKFYNKYWNRPKHDLKIKSITVRGISACLTIFTFIILHFWILYLLFR